MIFSSDMRACFSLLRAVAVGESWCEWQGEEGRTRAPFGLTVLGWGKGMMWRQLTLEHFDRHFHAGLRMAQAVGCCLHHTSKGTGAESASCKETARRQGW